MEAVAHDAYDWLLDNLWVRRAAAVVVIWILVLIITRVSEHFFDRIDRRLTEFGEPARRLSNLDSLFDIFVVAIGVLVSLYALGLGPALWGALALTGVVGIIVGLAAQRVGQNLLAGLVILFERPFAVGDVVETGPHTGRVTKVTLMSTSLATADGPVVYVPNNLMVDQPVRNISAAATRRVQVTIDVLESRDLDAVRLVLQRAPLGDPHLDRSRPVEVFATESLDDGIRWTVRYHVDRAEFPLHCEPAAMGLVLEALNEAGLKTALPTQRVHIANDNDEPVD